jgi:hypothetical protein
MDEIPRATVDERAVANATEVLEIFALKWVNNGPSQYISIHHQEYSRTKFRKERASTGEIYTVDGFLKYINIHQQASPSITVL